MSKQQGLVLGNLHRKIIDMDTEEPVVLDGVDFTIGKALKQAARITLPHQQGSPAESPEDSMTAMALFSALRKAILDGEDHIAVDRGDINILRKRAHFAFPVQTFVQLNEELTLAENMTSKKLKLKGEEGG